MPTRYWLVDATLRRLVGRLESVGGVQRAEADVDPAALERAHLAYARRTRPRDRSRSPRSATLRRGRRDPHRREVPACPSRPPPRGRRRPGRALGRSASRRGPRPVMTVFGAIDCGTNSTRLLVARVSDGQVLTEHREMRITRLGEGVDAAGRLSGAAVDRTVAVLADYGETLRELGVERTRITATSAARDAGEPRSLLRPCRGGRRGSPGTAVGRPTKPSSASSVQPPTCRASTDRFWSSTSAVVRPSSPSAPMSSRRARRSTWARCRFTESYLHGDPPAPEELSACIQIARAHLDDVIAGSPRRRSGEDLRRSRRDRVDRRCRRVGTRHLRP